MKKGYGTGTWGSSHTEREHKLIRAKNSTPHLPTKEKTKRILKTHVGVDLQEAHLVALPMLEEVHHRIVQMVNGNSQLLQPPSEQPTSYICNGGN